LTLTGTTWENQWNYQFNVEEWMRKSSGLSLMLSIGLLAVPLSAGQHKSPAAAGASQKIAAPSSQNPNDVLAGLLTGNKRFINSSCLYSNQDQKRRSETAKNGQKPLATILSCSDSRVPPEIIFDQGIGDLFVVRVAGNIVDKIEIGSIEYGASHLGTPLLMVLGHTKCGAVTAAVKGGEVHGSIAGLIDKIKPVAEKTRAERKDLSEDDLILKTIKANIFKTIEDIFRSSPEIRTRVREGKLKVIGALYDIETGVVSDLGVHYKQEALVRGKGK
jgi:carbonic anhydrase